MRHKVKLTVIDKKLYPELQKQYCADSNAGPCPMYQVGDEFMFERYQDTDDFWRMGQGKQCSEAWDAFSRYIYTGLQGGSIMQDWMKDERVMITCCSDGTRPVIFKIERLDYKILYLDGIDSGEIREKVRAALSGIEGVTEVAYRERFAEVFMDWDIPDGALAAALTECSGVQITRID